MKHATAIALNKRLIERVESNTTDEAASSMIESADVFLCPEQFAREKVQFFMGTPQVIGFAGQLKVPGSYITADVLGVPVVATRDQQGVLRAFVNACAHKGARVAHGCGERSKLTCRFHGWTYALDGSLAGRPQEGCFDTADARCHLRALPVSDRGGLIVVGIDPAMPRVTVEHFLEEIAPEFCGFGFEVMNTLETRRFEVDANWKLVAGLSHESYHFATLHRDSVAAFLHANAVFDTFGSHSRWAFPMKGIERLKALPEAQWPGTVEGAINHTIFPGTVVITNPEDAQIIRVEPGDRPGHSVVYYSGVCRHMEKQESARSAYDFGGTVFETEDLPAAAECQQGLAAGQASVIIGRNEPVVQFWHRLWRKRLAETPAS